MSSASVIVSSRTAAQNAAVVTEFFDRYRAHDVDGMVDLCTINADFSYPPFEVWGKQRVLRGDGKVGTVGKPIWTGLINAFPNLSNVVHSVDANDEGDVVVQVDIGGTQQQPWGLVLPAGKTFSEPHIFIFRLNSDGLIESVTGYWNNAGISQQLGHMEVD
ncbi:nuclear transport factor 2 family protein [Arthrobacter sp. efr-133-TYG-118]|jgi:ketosteroid isomerase-like protein|uniref:nuclear transport factor 2 family protein n=1 Tax=Arthrobacter sp. efr-133-TYG-118 TaxID=3040279 RepID=UPI00254C8379|nr:nuclear transport factor 2 family protein [Arthrobacter sp. efr-133-TYG-118]